MTLDGLPNFQFPTPSSCSSSPPSSTSSSPKLYIDIEKSHGYAPKSMSNSNSTTRTNGQHGGMTKQRDQRSHSPSPSPGFTFPPKIATTFTNLPTCTCGQNVHKRGCPRYAMKVRFEQDQVVVLGPSEHSHNESGDLGVKIRHLGPPTDATFANIAEDRAISPVSFHPNGTLSLRDGGVVQAQVSEGMSQIVLKVEGRFLTFRPI